MRDTDGGRRLARAARATSFVLVIWLAVAPSPAGALGPTIEWLMTADGERRGVALTSDLAVDGPGWSLV
ncbi:MAG: hypothetical protein M1457_03055, partial [bacterium]|nr:hypothetical protein [bacterium]